MKANAQGRAASSTGRVVFRKLVDLAFPAVDLILDEANLIGGPTVRSRQVNPFAAGHIPMPVSGRG